ncbi:Bcr/CflA family multidrug efflux MFS transporter [Pseudomonas sp. MYb541]|jgi:DHA1 family bicyclomycin/chloramphenicol resistance-like MFS transporter|uniref:Bcr/CflA family multidrug efflux MFS transporter n=1 Tax=Pseudomonas TaxID=286 RepID=UPI0011A1B03B|nr:MULTISPECIES: Bcr/CflA family multidrug efflux MFS transporter [unclassified Pseudomonas]MBB6287447.1 DHA1 family bicyclomycin/chloramphenicol resistance-like MFS transporter [Pseudomonas sp. SJZ073]MBB6310626.1 DHA1 family bicyclomycin/chloramphenicol resistance-like MFS transporter [Pseudomonas sp. JAI120]NJJ56872.1 Bcr/CflA family multidrug efflux MFS transporter [Pseudomonas sp. B14(2022)]TWC63506.1 DHA1 family bicyclomycin/chloramphenicol resistance-like MFS transporter [Pseudomonas sp.
MKPRARLIVLLSSLTAFGPFSIDTYLPSFPQIAEDLSTSTAQVQHTISAFLAGLCLGMLCYGPLSDRYGRRPLLLGSLVLYAAATLGCLFAGSVEQLIAWRFFQALGGAGALVLARAVARDRVGLAEAAKVLSWMHVLTMMATLVAPMIGTWLVLIQGWRTIFATLFILSSLCLLLVALTLKESLPAQDRGASVGAAFAAYLTIARQPRAMALILCMSLGFGGMFAFITASPFVYVVYFGVSPRVFSALFALNILGIILVTFINARWVGRFGPQRMLGVGAVLVSGAGLALMLVGYTEWGGLTSIVCCMVLYMGVTGLIGANCMASLMMLFPRQAGASVALGVSVQFATGALASLWVSHLADGSAWPMCWVVGCCGMGSLVAYCVTLRTPARAVAVTAVVKQT